MVDITVKINKQISWIGFAFWIFSSSWWRMRHTEDADGNKDDQKPNEGFVIDCEKHLEQWGKCRVNIQATVRKSEFIVVSPCCHRFKQHIQRVAAEVFKGLLWKCPFANNHLQQNVMLGSKHPKEVQQQNGDLVMKPTEV